jgi:hypothetical protein
MSASKRCVYYDTEAYTQNHTGPGGSIVTRAHPKYRVCARQIAGIFLFFYTTGQRWQGRNYVDINPLDWENLKKKHNHIRTSKVEVSAPCYLTDTKVAEKFSQNKFHYVGTVFQVVLDKIENACRSGQEINPTGRKDTLPSELAFDPKKVVLDRIKQLGIGP